MVFAASKEVFMAKEITAIFPGSFRARRSIAVTILCMLLAFILGAVTSPFHSMQPPVSHHVSSFDANNHGTSVLPVSTSWESFSTEEERKQAIEQVLPSIRAISKVLSGGVRHYVHPRSCKVKEMGTGYGKHDVCDLPSRQRTCSFISIGISYDYSFDLDVAKRWRCRGFAADRK